MVVVVFLTTSFACLPYHDLRCLSRSCKGLVSAMLLFQGHCHPQLPLVSPWPQPTCLRVLSFPSFLQGAPTKPFATGLNSPFSAFPSLLPCGGCVAASRRPGRRRALRPIAAREEGDENDDDGSCERREPQTHFFPAKGSAVIPLSTARCILVVVLMRCN